MNPELCPVCKDKPAGHCRPKDQPEPELCYWCFVNKKRRERQREVARRRRHHPRVIACVDIDLAVAGLRKVPVLQELLGRRRIHVEVGHHAEGGCGGRAWSRSRRIRVYSGPETTQGRVLEVVLHELCHVATPSGSSHGERFRRVFARACKEAWGIEVPINPPPERGVRAYGQSKLVIEELDRLLSSHASIDTYPPKPTAPKSRADVVAKRAAHAAAMLAKAERKLKLARTVHKRWAAKVRYYECAAAKRSVRS